MAELSPATSDDSAISASTLPDFSADEDDDTFFDALHASFESQEPSPVEAESPGCSFSGVLRRRRFSSVGDSSCQDDRLLVDVLRTNLESQEATDSQVEDEVFEPAPLPRSPYPENLHHRPFLPRYLRSSIIYGTESGGEGESCSKISECGCVHGHGTGTSTGEGRFTVKPKAVVHENDEIVCEESDSRRSVIEEDGGESTAASANTDRDDDIVSVDSFAQSGRRWWSFLICIARLVIKAIGFLFKLAFRLLSLPALPIYYYYAFTTSPFRTTVIVTKHFMGCLMGVAGFVLKICRPFTSRWSKVTLRFSWGLLFSAFVCIILVGMLISSFLMSGLALRHLAVEPLHMKETLYFDYTKNSPEAYFPITSCVGSSCAVNCVEKLEFKKGLRVIPHKHKFQVTISLTLPESDYNRNLGIFQVRVDCLSANGISLATLSHPRMMPFKCWQVRHLLTWLKIAPLLAGYTSESQTLSLQIRGFTETDVPTACLKVMIEPRAEWRQAAGGVPEIYEASLLLESDLTFLQRTLCYWKKTAFVWMSMTLFMMGLLLTLTCCMSLLLQRQPSEDSARHAHNGGPHCKPPQDGQMVRATFEGRRRVKFDDPTPKHTSVNS